MAQQDLYLLLIHQIGQTGGLQVGIWTFYLSTSSSLGSPAADPTKSSVSSDGDCTQPAPPPIPFRLPVHADGVAVATPVVTEPQFVLNDYNDYFVDL